MADESSENLLMRTADIVAAHVSNNSVAIADLPDVIRRIHAALSGLGTPTEAAPEELKPAISIRASIKPDYIVCLDDGKKVKMLRRHLMPHSGRTPTDYHTNRGLP